MTEHVPHPINGTGRLLEHVRCRICGAHGLEDPAIDPNPGYCPRCYERQLADLFGLDDVPADDASGEDVPLDQIKRAAGDPMLPGFA